jgi:cold shock protein
VASGRTPSSTVPKRGSDAWAVPRGAVVLPEGTIKRLTDKGFGFVDAGRGKDFFFHMSAVKSVQFEDLTQGQRVSFVEGQGPKGPRAENVKPI